MLLKIKLVMEDIWIQYECDIYHKFDYDVRQINQSTID